MNTRWRRSIDAVGKKMLPPDPDVLEAIGLGHEMPSALADLVDNSIDARASQILIRFVEVGGTLASLVVVDDGDGMDDKMIDEAMTVGKRRDYEDKALGHFGMGLKAASFSQADVLTVMSKKKRGIAVGRRLMRTGSRSFECDVLDPAQVQTELETLALNGDSGTIVRWDSVRTFPAATERRVTDDYLARTFHASRTHLGLVLHRILTTSKARIALDVFDADSGETGSPQTVESIDPFGYRRSGFPGYPKAFDCKAGGGTIPLTAHVWPPRSEALGYRLDGTPEGHQGFYFYRNDRLLEAGGWKGAAVPHRRLQLARITVDITAFPKLFTMNMEKNSVYPLPEFIRAVERSQAADGTTFKSYLAAAEETFRLGNQRNTGRHEVIPPGAGIAPDVKRAITNELPMHEGRNALEIRWKWLPGEDFFEVDRTNDTLWLNSIYRKGLLGGQRGGLNDLPVIKSLLYLLMEDIFRGPAFGARDKDNVEIWQAILTPAVQAEINER